MFIWNNQENLEQETNTSSFRAASAGGFRLTRAFVVKGRRRTFTPKPQFLWEGNQWHWFPACSNEAWWVRHAGLESTTHSLDDFEQIIQPHLLGCWLHIRITQKNPSNHTHGQAPSLQIDPGGLGWSLGISVFISPLVIVTCSQAEQRLSKSVPPWRQKS